MRHMRVAHQMDVGRGVVHVERGRHRRRDDVVELPDVGAHHNRCIGEPGDFAECRGASQDHDEPLANALEVIDPHADLVGGPGRYTVVEDELRVVRLDRSVQVIVRVDGFADSPVRVECGGPCQDERDQGQWKQRTSRNMQLEQQHCECSGREVDEHDQVHGETRASCIGDARHIRDAEFPSGSDASDHQLSERQHDEQRDCDPPQRTCGAEAPSDTQREQTQDDANSVFTGERRTRDSPAQPAETAADENEQRIDGRERSDRRVNTDREKDQRCDGEGCLHEPPPEPADATPRNHHPVGRRGTG